MGQSPNGPVYGFGGTGGVQAGAARSAGVTDTGVFNLTQALYPASGYLRGRVLSWSERITVEGGEWTLTAYDILRDRVTLMILAGVPSMQHLIPGGFGALFMRQFLMTEGQRMVQHVMQTPQRTAATSSR
jgi:hypothetical protein